MATIGENVRRLRIAAGFKTQGALAKHLGVEQPQVSDWENDRYEKLDITTVLRLAKGIGCSIEDLVVGVDKDYTPWHERGVASASEEVRGNGPTTRALQDQLAAQQRARRFTRKIPTSAICTFRLASGEVAAWTSGSA